MKKPQKNTLPILEHDLAKAAGMCALQQGEGTYKLGCGSKLIEDDEDNPYHPSGEEDLDRLFD